MPPEAGAHAVALGIASEHLRQGRFDAAHAVLRRILEESPEELAAIHGLAAEAAARGEPDRAISLLEAALAAHPNDATSLGNLAGLHLAAGRVEAARLCLDRAEALAPQASGLQAMRAQLRAAEGDAAGAIRIATALAEAAPRDSDRRYNLAVLLLGAGQLPEAEAEFRATISLAPQMREAWHNLGQVLAERGAMEEAIGCLRNALLLRPGEPAGVSALADALIGAGQPEAAEAEARRGLVVAPQAPLLLLALARAQLVQGRFAEALAEVARVVRAMPDQPLPFLTLADGFAMSGNAARAAAAAEQAAALAKDAPPLLLSAAQMLLRCGRFEAGWAMMARAAPAGLLSPFATAGGDPPLALPTQPADILRFARVLPLALARGLQPRLFGEGRFAALLASPDAPLDAAPPPPAALPLMALALWLRPDPIAQPLAPMRIDPARVAAWRAALAGRARPVVAIACGHVEAGEPALPEVLAALGGRGTRIGLLAGDSRRDMLADPAMLDAGPYMEDPMEVAAAMLAADLIVAGGGAAGHLAGTLGCAGAVLLPPMADWCWGLPGGASAWYPSLCTLWQRGRDWAPALSQLAAMAEAWDGAAPSPHA